LSEPARLRPPAPVGERPVRARLSLRRRAADRAAAIVVRGGGLAIVASILAMFFFLLFEAWPLLRRARVGVERVLEEAGALAATTDEYRSHLVLLSPDGALRAKRFEDGSEVARWNLLSDSDLGLDGAMVAPGSSWIAAWTRAGRVLAVPIRWRVRYEDDRRVVSLEPPEPVWFDFPFGPRGIAIAAVQGNEWGAAVAIAQGKDGRMATVRRIAERNPITGETAERWARWVSAEALPFSISSLVVSQDQQKIYAGTRSGELIAWELLGESLGTPVVSPPGAPVGSLTLLIGHRSLVVGRQDGSVEIWFLVRGQTEGASSRWARVREFPPHPTAIRTLAPSLRDRTFLCADGSGRLALYYSTSGRILWSGRSPVGPVRSAFFAPKGDGAVLAGPDGVASLRIENPHPETSLRTLFGKVWYEGYPGPEFAWQSSSGTDDFEPKLSLTPLVFGTLKGTLYSLLLAIPLGVLGAMYASQFMHPALKAYVKPTVEIMAALPSVVLGFLAGLWLAPRMERVFPGLVLAHLVLPAGILALGLGLRALPASLRQRLPLGNEIGLYVVFIGLALWGCMAASPWLEATLFGGNFPEWLYNATGWRYEQRNAIVVGIAMGFAVIPIIFSVAEEAFSNVPSNLVSASLALGATRWQTVTRVVFPTASPGVFSAVMIGFGRAVGETMIVLMATGNTPIMDWSPWNGFRTLSANIAVEIPEAPFGSTLYRTLFVSGLLLFSFTFAVNTVAEMLRRRLRQRHGRL